MPTGKVIDGMQYVHDIKKGDPAANGMVDHPDKIIRMRVASQADK